MDEDRNAEDNHTQFESSETNRRASPSEQAKQSLERWKIKSGDPSVNSAIRSAVLERNTDAPGTKEAHNTLRSNNLIKLTSIDAVTNEQTSQDPGATMDQRRNSTLDRIQFQPGTSETEAVSPTAGQKRSL